MSINVTVLPPPPSVLQQVVTSINATNNEAATKEVVLDPTGLLLGYKTKNKSFGSVYFNNNSTSSVVATANTYVLLSNTSYTLNVLSSNFSLTGAPSSRLTYNGSSSAVFKVSCNSSYLCAGANNQNISLQLSQNGVLIPNSKASSSTQNALMPRCASMDTIVTMAPSDYIELQLTNTTAANNVTVTDVNINAYSLH